MKYLTIDIECDISSKLCRELFQNNNHRDPNSRMWIYTITYNNNGINKSISKICKLPQQPRVVIGDNGIKKSTGIYHDSTNVINKEIFDSKIIEFDDYNKYINALHADIEWIKQNNLPLFFYGWYDNKNNIHDDYDYEMIKSIFTNYSIDTSVLDCMINVNRKFGIRKPFTTSQIKKGQYIPNQEYMNIAIKHNIEDSIFLSQEIERNKDKIIWIKD